MSSSLTEALIAKPNEHPFAPYVRILGKGKKGSRSLTLEEAQHAMQMILAGEATAEQIGAFLMLLRVKEESAAEIAGFVLASRHQIAAPGIGVDFDWSSYAGKRKHLPWYLLCAMTLADQGIRVFMHGTSGHTAGRIYTEQVLEALGIPASRHWDDVELQLEQQQFAFMALDVMCKPLYDLIELRNFLGLRSPVHTFCRLMNPLQARYSMQGIFHPAYMTTHQQAAKLLGQANMAVIKGEGGEIERKADATCKALMLQDGHEVEEQWPRLLSDKHPVDEDLQIEKLVAVWRGDSNDQYAEQAITGTLAIALKMMGRAQTQESALTLATDYWQARNRNRL